MNPTVRQARGLPDALGQAQGPCLRLPPLPLPRHWVAATLTLQVLGPSEDFPLQGLLHADPDAFLISPTHVPPLARAHSSPLSQPQ